MTRLLNFTITLIDDAIKAHSNNNVKELIEKIAKQREKDQSILEECLKELQAYADEGRDIGESGQSSHDEETSTLSRGITSEEITITATVMLLHGHTQFIEGLRRSPRQGCSRQLHFELLKLLQEETQLCDRFEALRMLVEFLHSLFTTKKQAHYPEELPPKKLPLPQPSLPRQ